MSKHTVSNETCGNSSYLIDKILEYTLEICTTYARVAALLAPQNAIAGRKLPAGRIVFTPLS